MVIRPVLKFYFHIFIYLPFSTFFRWFVGKKMAIIRKKGLWDDPVHEHESYSVLMLHVSSTAHKILPRRTKYWAVCKDILAFLAATTSLDQRDV